MKDKVAKADYDREYRAKNRDLLRIKKANAYALYGPANRDREREVRKKRMPSHIEYCRHPKYRDKKKQYDLDKRVSAYGEYAGCYLMLRELMQEIRKKEPDRSQLYRESGRKQWSISTQQERRRRRAEAKNR